MRPWLPTALLLAGCAQEVAESPTATPDEPGQPPSDGPASNTSTPVVLRWNKTYNGETGTALNGQSVASRDVSGDLGLPGRPGDLVVEMRCRSAPEATYGGDPGLRLEIDGESPRGGMSYGWSSYGHCLSGMRIVVSASANADFVRMDSVIVGAVLSTLYVDASGELEFALSAFDARASEDYSAFDE